MAKQLHRRGFLAAGAVSLLAAPALAQGAGTPPPSGSPDVWAFLNGVPASERLGLLQREATKEGRVVVYGALGIDRGNVFITPFQARYPGVQVDFVRLREPELVERINLEARANRLGGGVAISNVPWLDLLKPSLGGYVPTSWDRFEPGYLFGSAADRWTAIAYEVLPSTISWRTDRVEAASAPRTLADLADPKWRGKVGTTSQLEAAIDGLEAALGQAEGAALVDRLAALDNKLYPSHAALSDGLSIGEIDIAWNLGAHRPVRLKDQGAPIDFAFQVPLLGLGITVSTINRGPGSYASALLMEFLTEPSTLQALDRSEGGRIFGLKGGTFSIDISRLPPLTMFRSIDQRRFTQLSRLAEQKFLRRR